MLIKSLKAKPSLAPNRQGTQGIGYIDLEKAEILAISIENQCTPNDSNNEDDEEDEEFEDLVLNLVHHIDEDLPVQIDAASF